MTSPGSCGALRYTRYSSGFIGFTAWFGGDGALVAATRFADTASFCGGTSFSQSYGPTAACDLRATAEYCH